MRAFNIILNDKQLNIVTIEVPDFNVEDLRQSLVNNEGYDSNITLEEIDMKTHVIISTK
jgi:hypothetical protein